MNRKVLFMVIAVVVFAFFALPKNAYCLEDMENMGLYGRSLEEVDIDSLNDYAYTRIETPAGIYKAPVGSSGWIKLEFPVSDGATSLGVTQDNGYVYASTISSMYYSADGGASW